MNFKTVQEYLRHLKLSLPTFIFQYGTSEQQSTKKRQKRAYYRASRIRKGLDDLTVGEKKLLEIKKLLSEETEN